MKITITAIFALCVCALTSFGQNTYTIKGVTVDTISKAKLTTTVTVLNAKDSIMQRYTHTGADGSFSMSGIPAGKYLLWVTYPDYASYEQAFTLDATNREFNFGNINMQDRAKLLQEVVIKGEVKAIKIKGDTTEYNARAFVIQPNDKVEDLLKQLPDVHVDKDGKITAQGETVPKILVDGEEFFGDDPLLVTRNLRADMVDKVQIYNKKSDQAVFTGIDDGKTTKTINVTLREDKKTGMFGKGVVGVGNDGYYESQLMFNKFKGKYKFSAYGTAANDGKTGLGYQDASRLGASSSNVVTFDDGSIGITIGGGDALDNATYNGQGLPVARTAGVHYDTKWGEDKQSINTNYKLGDMSLNIATKVNSEQNFPTGSINRASSTNSDNHTFRQKADVMYQNNIDANTSVKFTVDGTQRSTDNKSTSSSTATDGNGVLLNKESRSDNSAGEQKLFNATFLFTKKLKKPSRTLSWNVSEAFSQTDTKRYLNSVITIPTRATPDTTTAQYQPTTSISSVLNSNITFTEPITSKLALTFNYGFGINNGTSERQSFNESAPGVYSVFDPIYSNSFKLNQLTNQLGAMFNYRGGDKIILTFGTKATGVNFKQINQYTNTVYKRDFINWAPQAVFRYRMSPSSNFSVNYSGSATQPTIDQVQPIRVNTDLQNITVGNANLNPQFRHNFSTSYSSSKTVSAQYFSFSGNYSFTTNTITTNNVTDITTGRSITQFVNFTDKNPYNYNVRASFSRRVLGITPTLSLSHNASVGYSYINGLAAENSNRSYNATVDLQTNKPNKYSLFAYGGPTYSFLKNQLPTSVINNNSLGYTVYGQGTLYLPGKFQLASDFNYSYQGATQSVPALATRMWNGSISKTFLKGDNLRLSFSGNNLLNQDQIRRTPTAIGLTQSTTNTIRRFFMLTISWDFTKFGTMPTQN